jgi:hypothetical protein
LTWDYGEVDGDLGLPLMETAKRDVLPEKVSHIYLYKPNPPRPKAKRGRRKSAR